MKKLFNRCLKPFKKPEVNAWLHLQMLMWSLKDIILPALLIDMYERDMRDMLSVFQRNDDLITAGPPSK